MTMDTQLKAGLVFHLTGRRADGGTTDATIAGLRPALTARHRDLESLRYDFPVVLAGAGDDWVRPLSGLVDEALRAVAPAGVAGEARRRRGLAIEREMRRLTAAGAQGTLSELWDRAAGTLAPPSDTVFHRDARVLRDSLSADGPVADCDASLPARFLRHAWAAVQRDRARVARERIDRLAIRLGEILRADRARSSEALAGPALQASIGTAHHRMFDFDAMSRLLARGGPRGGLGERRRRRVEEALDVLVTQRFFPRGADPKAPPAHEFEFRSAAAALAAFRERLPEAARLLKALQVAELEVDGSYVEDVHDAIFASYDERSVTAEDLALFPDYLVCLEHGEPGAAGTLSEALSSGVPLKVVVHVADLVEESALGQGRFAFGVRAAQLASASMGLEDVFVLQTAASNLLQLRSRVERGLRYGGPALFSVYAAPAGGPLPAYLRTAAAMQSRAFPAFSYDPAAGTDLASRFSLENNPQPESDWPVDDLEYADQELQAVKASIAFTYADFALCDGRLAGHFDVAPRALWAEGMIQAQEWLARPPEDPAGALPYVLAVDEADLLCRLVVDERLMRAALRCRDAWHRLQELGGIHDSHAARLIARERKAWEEEHRREAAAAPPAAAAPAAAALQAAEPAAQAPAAAPAAAEAEAARNPDEAYIETVRCSTCNECTQVNPRMFAYNENKQAYIADLKAGTYRQLVEAAESCQVSVIHPGKPWDPEEPGLEELVERAKPFR